MKTSTKVVVGAVVALALAGGAAVSRAVAPMWQGAAAWGAERLGLGSSTIAKAGCLLTLFTMASNALRGTAYTPLDVNRKLIDAQAFSGSSLFPDVAARALRLTMGERKTTSNVAELRRIVDAALDKGGLAVLQVDHDGNTTGDHFVLVNGRTASGYTAADPAPAKIVSLTSSLGGPVKWGSTTKNYRAVSAFGLTVAA